MIDDPIEIRALQGDAEAWTCADMMASSEPWITLGRERENNYQVITRPNYEAYVAVLNDQIVGVIVFAQKVPLLGGYISTLAVAPQHRNRQIGQRLLAFAEELIFRNARNTFLCVSSFNTPAQRFYERHGYTRVGELTDFIIAGAHEILMRKAIGPLVS